MKHPEAKDRIIVALDASQFDEATRLIQDLLPLVGAFYIGLDSTSIMQDLELIDSIHERGGRVLYDTRINGPRHFAVIGAKTAAAHGVSMFSIDVACDAASIRAAIDNRGASKIVANVTVGQKGDRISSLFETEEKTHLLPFVQTFTEEGGDVVLCAPKDIMLLREGFLLKGAYELRKRKGWERLRFIASNPEPDWYPNTTQKRVMTPRDAIHAGADYILVGQPIRKPPKELGSPMNAARAIAADIQSAL
jgi:orotidine-5'-phosphate decarboxylase